MEAKLSDLGVSFPREQLLRLVEVGKATALQTKKPMGTAEFKKLVNSMVMPG